MIIHNSRGDTCGDTWWKKLGHYRNYTYDTTTVNATTTTDTTSIEFPRNNNNYNYREQEESWLDRWFLFYFILELDRIPVVIESVHFSSPHKTIEYVKNMVKRWNIHKYNTLLFPTPTNEISLREGPIEKVRNNRIKK